MLPLLKGWRYDPKTVESQVCNRKTPVVTVQNERGWFFWALGTLDNPNAHVRVTYDDYYTSHVSPLELFAAGLLTSNSSGFWVGTYNPILSRYCIFFTPFAPHPFAKSLLIEIEPPSGQTVTIVQYGHLLIRIDDAAAFEKSLKSLLGVAK